VSPIIRTELWAAECTSCHCDWQGIKPTTRELLLKQMNRAKWQIFADGTCFCWQCWEHYLKVNDFLTDNEGLVRFTINEGGNDGQ
jgi:hypothetical protein